MKDLNYSNAAQIPIVITVPDEGKWICIKTFLVRTRIHGFLFGTGSIMVNWTKMPLREDFVTMTILSIGLLFGLKLEF